MTEAQKKRQAEVFGQFREKMQRAAEGAADRQQFRAAGDAIFAEAEAALQEDLEPGQRDRLDQIQLQVEGPLAFVRPELARRLKLSDDQADQVKTIAEQWREDARRAPAVPLNVRPEDRPTNLETARKLAESREFQEAKETSKRAMLALREAAMGRIDKILTEPQRASYRAMLGERFDSEGAPCGQGQRGGGRRQGRGEPGGPPRAARRPRLRRQGRPPRLYVGAPEGPLRRGPPQLPHGRRPVQGVRGPRHQRRLPRRAEHGEALGGRAGPGRHPGRRQRPEGRGGARIHRGRVRGRPRLGQGRRGAAADQRSSPLRPGRRGPGQVLRGGHEPGHDVRPGELGSAGPHVACCSPATTTCWATTRSPTAATSPSGSTASRPSPASRSRGRRGASPS